MTDERFTLVPLDENNAALAGDVFRSVYGEDFPFRDVYRPEALCRDSREGRLAATLAFDAEDRPVGYVSMFRTAPNPRLWEGGNLIVDPACRYSDLALILFRHYLKPENMAPFRAEGIFCEAVCHHYFTQTGCAKSGMADCAVELDLLDGESFKDNRADTGRVACVLSFLEFAPPTAPLYLPVEYDEILRQLAHPLFPRSFRPAVAPLPTDGPTVREERYYPAARTWKLFVREIGSDWQNFLDEIVIEAAERDVISLPVVLNAALPHLGTAVEMMRKRGFFLGGLAPRWFGSDGLLMQKVLGREPDFDGIRLYTRTARELLAFVRSDRDRARPMAGEETTPETLSGGGTE